MDFIRNETENEHRPVMMLREKSIMFQLFLNCLFTVTYGIYKHPSQPEYISRLVMFVSRIMVGDNNDIYIKIV